MIGFIATELVSLKGSPTVSPTTVASCSGVPLACSSVSTIFLALSQAPPALAMKTAWNSPLMAMPIRYPMNRNSSANAAASVMKKTPRKMLNMPAWAYRVQMATTRLLSAMLALSAPSSLMFFLMNSTARYVPVMTACMLAPLNQ